MNGLDDTIKRSARAAVLKVVEDVVTDDFVCAALRRLFAKKPKVKLNAKGFNLAMGLALNDIWPDLPVWECSRLMREELKLAGVSYDDSSHEWTAADAKELAKEYASAYGEAAA